MRDSTVISESAASHLLRTTGRLLLCPKFAIADLSFWIVLFRAVTVAIILGVSTVERKVKGDIFTQFRHTIARGKAAILRVVKLAREDHVMSCAEASPFTTSS